MKPFALCNGVEVANPVHAVAIDDRGLNYGDGLFETCRLRDGTVRFLDAHLQRLRAGCERLSMAFPSELAADIERCAATQHGGILKIVLTRGAGGRGYRPTPSSTTNRLLTLHPLPGADAEHGLTLRWCDTRFSRNATLAGMKHLNRLEQVLAQNEWHDAGIDEGLMCDTEGELVSATACNVFIVRNDTLLTPDLRFSGVRGVMRGEVLRAARQLGIKCHEEPLWPHDLEEASEVFLTNAIRAIRPVAMLSERRWSSFTVARQLAQALEV